MAFIDGDIVQGTSLEIYLEYLREIGQNPPESLLGEEIDIALKTLSPREAQIINLYFGLTGDKPLTLEEIGVRFGLTRERIRQIKEKAIKRLRHATRSKVLRAYLQQGIC